MPKIVPPEEEIVDLKLYVQADIKEALRTVAEKENRTMSKELLHRIEEAGIFETLVANTSQSQNGGRK